MNVQAFYLVLLILCLIINIIIIYCILYQIKNINSGDILILVYCFNNIIFCISFIIEIIFNYIQIYDNISCTLQSFIIIFNITLNCIYYFLIALRSYFKITFDYSFTNKNICICLIFSILLNLLCVVGFGSLSNYNIMDTYCMFDYNSTIILAWVYPILIFMFFSILYLYKQIYNSTLISQTSAKSPFSSRHKTLTKKETLNTTVNRKLLRMIIMRISIYLVQIIMFCIYMVSNKYTNILWIIMIIINILISSIIYGFSNNKVQSFLEKKPKLKIIINRLSEKKMNIKTIKTAFEESLPSPRINSMCIIIDKVNDERKEQSKIINTGDNIGSVENSINVSSYSAPQNLTIDPNLSPLSTPEQSPDINQERKKDFILPPIKKGKISPYDTSPSDLRKLRLQNIMREKRYILDIPILNIPSG